MKPLPIWLIIGCLLLSGLPGAINTARAEEDSDSKLPKLEDIPRLTVRGEAEVEVPADILRVNIGVLTEHKEANKALQSNSRQMNGVIDALLREGLGEDEYETGRFRLRPLHSRRPRQADENWKPEIIGYEVLNSITIKTKQLELAGTLLEAANEAGANTIDAVGFELSDDHPARQKAITKATSQAIVDAHTLASAASLKLVRIITIRLDSADSQPTKMDYNRRLGAASASPPPITPGKVKVSAEVQITYEITSQVP